MVKWGLSGEDDTCDCEELQTNGTSFVMQHASPVQCTKEDLIMKNRSAQKCAKSQNATYRTLSKHVICQTNQVDFFIFFLSILIYWTVQVLTCILFYPNSNY